MKLIQIKGSVYPDGAIMKMAEYFVKFRGLQSVLHKIHHRNIRMVCYHMVKDASTSYYPPNITTDVFREQIRYLKNNYEIISVKEALERIKQGDKLHRALSITTDDGFAEDYSVTAPILAEEKVTATFFVTSNCLDNKQLMWRNKVMHIQNKLEPAKLHSMMNRLAKEFRLAAPAGTKDLLTWSYFDWSMQHKEMLSDRLWEMAGLEPISEWLAENRPYLTVGQIKELQHNGFHIGAHTKTHPFCDRLSYAELKEEVLGSIDHLSSTLQSKIDVLAYPFGARPTHEMEQRLIREHADKISGLFGLQYSISNKRNPYAWDRDTMPANYNQSILKLSVMGIKRKLLKTIGMLHAVFFVANIV